jgi:hypothetical protein
VSTLAQFRTNIAYALGLGASPSSDDLAQIDRRVNEAVGRIQRAAGVKTAIGIFSLTPGTADYTWDTSILAIKEVARTTSSGTDYYPQRVAPAEILELRVNSESGSPCTRYAVEGLNMLMVYPTPVAADDVTIYYVPAPAVLSATGDTPSEIRSDFHDLVEEYAKWKIAEDMGADYGGIAARAKANYEEGVKDLRKAMRSMGGRHLSARIWPLRHPLSSDPSQDTGW